MKPKIREVSLSTKQSPFPPDFSYQPWLIQTAGEKNADPKFINPFEGSIERKKLPEMQGKLCLGYYGEWLLLLDVSCSEMFFVNLALDSKIHLPPVLESFETLGGCVITCCPTCPKCVIIFVVKDQSYLLHCRPQDHNLKKVQCNFQKDHFFHGDIVMCQGKLYAFVYHDDAIKTAFTDVESVINGTASWTTITRGFVRYNRFSSEKPYLVVFNDNVFLVGVCFHGRGVRDVDVHSFQISKTKHPYWGNEIGTSRFSFFVGWNNNMSFTPSQETLQQDCVYVLRQYDDGELLYKINIDEGITSVNIVLKLLIKDKNKFCWIVPSKTRRFKWEASKIKSSCITTSIEQKSVKEGSKEENTNDILRQWTDMPAELLELVLEKLSLVDCIYIPTICRVWSSIPNHIHEAKVWPWLMYCPKDDGLCRFIDPFYGKEYCMDLKSMLGCEIFRLRFSKGGWVLISTGNLTMFVINPFTRNVVKLPSHTRYRECIRYPSFNSLPTSSNFIVFGYRSYDFITWTPQEKEWRHGWTHDSREYTFKNLHNNFVFFCGEIYFFDKTGCLAVFNPESGKRRVLDRPTPIDSEFESYYCYLIEFEGELISVFQGNKKMLDPIRVYRLDQNEMAWTQLDDLGDLMLFLDPASPMAKRCPFKSCANRIYLPIFDDKSKHLAFYSMETNKYYPKVYNMTEPWNYVWIEPNFNS